MNQTWYLTKMLVLKVLDMFESLQRGADVSGAAVWSSGSKVKVRNMHIWLFEARESSVGVFSVALNIFFYCEMCVIFLCLRVNQGGGNWLWTFQAGSGLDIAGRSLLFLSAPADEVESLLGRMSAQTRNLAAPPAGDRGPVQVTSL